MELQIVKQIWRQGNMHTVGPPLCPLFGPPDMAGAFNMIRVSNLPRLHPYQLQLIFETFGPVRSVYFRHDQMGRRVNEMTVLFFESGHARAAMCLNGRIFDGRRVRLYLESPNIRHAWHTNILVSNIPPTYRMSDLLTIYSQYGYVISCRMFYTTYNRRIPNGKGFVRYRSRTEAERAIEATNEDIGRTNPLIATLAKPQVWTCRRASKFPVSIYRRNVKIYIGNLPSQFPDIELVNLFLPYGPISCVRIMRNKNGLCMGSAFVIMVRHVDGRRAIYWLTDTIFLDRKLRIYAVPDINSGASNVLNNFRDI